MTTNDTVSASIDADRAKKLAHSVKKRLADLGVQVCLNHAYEAVAAMHGHTNWATMKASLGKPHDGNPASGPGEGSREPLAPQFVLSVNDDGSARVKLPPLACLDHFHVAGFEGDDKAAVLLGMAQSSLEQRAGFMLCDSSGDGAVVERVRRLARLYGREKDVSVLDLTGRRSSSASINLFRLLKPSELARVFVDIMKASDSRDREWHALAASCAAGAWEALLWMHEHKGEGLSHAALKGYLDYGRLRAFAYDAASGHLPNEIRSRIKKYLESIPGVMRMRSPTEPTQVVLDAHGDVVMQIIKVLDRLERDFGRVLTEHGSVDVFDHVVDGGKILVVLIPTVEHRGDPEAFAGTFIHSSFAQWLSRRANKGIARSRRGRQPFLAIFDEVDGYEVRDRDFMARDAKAAGISLAFSDFPNTRHPKPSPAGSTLIHAWEGITAAIHGEITYTNEEMRAFR